MCRKNLYFRGLRQKAEKWNDEHREEVIQKAFNEMIEDLFEEEIDELTLPWLSFLSKRFEEIRNCGWYDLTEDDIDYLMFNEAEDCEEENVKVYRDIPTWLIFFRALISQHPFRKSKTIKGPTCKGYNDAPEPIMYILV